MESTHAMAGRLSSELLSAAPAERRDPAFEQRARALLMRIDPAKLDLILAVFLASIARSLEASPDALFGPGWSTRIRSVEDSAVAGGAAEPSYDREWDRLMREVRAPLVRAMAPTARPAPQLELRATSA